MIFKLMNMSELLQLFNRKKTQASSYSRPVTGLYKRGVVGCFPQKKCDFKIDLFCLYHTNTERQSALRTAADIESEREKI